MDARRPTAPAMGEPTVPLDRWVAIDFETATREATSACALGIAVIEGLDIVDTASWLIRPPFNEYEFWNTKVHGLSSEDTELAPEFDELWWEIGPLLGGAGLLAHNAPFDMRVLRALIDTRELTAPAYEYACTVTVARRALPELSRHTLDRCCDHFGIVFRHHDARADAEACARVAIECARRTGASSVGETLSSLGVATRRL